MNQEVVVSWVFLVLSIGVLLVSIGGIMVQATGAVVFAICIVPPALMTATLSAMRLIAIRRESDVNL